MFKKNLCRGKDNLDIAKKELLEKKRVQSFLSFMGFFFSTNIKLQKLKMSKQ